MKPIIKFKSVPAQNGAPEQVCAFIDFEANGELDRLTTVPFADKDAAVKHLIRLDPDLFEGGYEIEEEEQAQ